MIQIGDLAAVDMVIEVLDELVLENKGVRHCSKAEDVSRNFLDMFQFLLV
jgi:hypothetical protein